jgi:repressor LexA
MFEDLNKRQREIIEIIKNYVNKNGYPPSVREIGKAAGLSSSSTVHSHLTQLEKKGFIRRDPTKPRAIELLIEYDNDNVQNNEELIKVPVLGKITAGEPILAVENIEDSITLPLSLTGNGSTFILNVRGDSMIEAGIFNNDQVIVRKQSTAINGDIVAALLYDEATIKRFYKEDGHIRLQPENKHMSPIITKDVKILGKVTAIIRKL